MQRVTTFALGAALAALLAAAPSARQSPAPADTWLNAVDEWNAGHYPDALRDLTALSNGPAARDYHDRIALLTGELFTTTEITTEGRNPRMSANGDYVAYEAGPVGATTVTRVVSLRPSPRQIAELPTSIAAFDPSGRRLAWIRSGQSGTPDAHTIVIRDLSTGAERALLPDGLMKTDLTWSSGGDGIVFVGGDPNDASRTDVFLAKPGSSPVRLSAAGGHKVAPLVDPTGAVIVYTVAPASPFGGRAMGPPTATVEAVVLNLKDGSSRTISGIAPGSLTMSADGSTLAWIGRAPDGAETLYASAPLAPTPTAIRGISGAERLAAPTLSPNGQLVAYQFQARNGSSTDWEIYASDRAGNHRRITRDIQHDVLPRFLDNRTLLGVIGEPRHRRSHLYDLDTGTRTRVFHNNTVRTISPEYSWASSADGRHLAIQADRDGDVVSPARGIYVVDLTRKVTPAELSSRLKAQAQHEDELRRRMTAAFAPLSSEIRRAVSRVSITRVYECHRAMAAFDSKYIGQPGNLKAIEYLERMYASFGYKPEVQWFNAGGANGPKTANVMATRRGAVNPDVIYVVSSHFDSILGGTGADDDTSGTCALLEAARVLADAPLPATVVFASFTGEEAGLYGSREFVRLAAERKWQVAGALNNDMIGWSADGVRIDNTIRYSNAGIRDVQHGAAFLFTDLVLFDSRYYRGTDAATFNDVWGDIVGGIGSYPILANPNYHQPSDLPETIDYRQVAETAKVTAASIYAMASSPARLRNVSAVAKGQQIEITWTPAAESGVTSYVVTYGPPTNPQERRLTVKTPRVTLPNAPSGTQVAVKAVNARGLESWDWARTVVK